MDIHLSFPGGKRIEASPQAVTVQCSAESAPAPPLPDLYAIGLLPKPDARQQTTFEQLNDANAINLFAPRRNAVVLSEDQSDRWQASLEATLAQDLEPGASIPDREALRHELLQAARADSLPGCPPRSRRCWVAVRSQKGRALRSTSLGL